MADIKALVASLDIAPPTVVPTTQPEAAVHVTQANPRILARTLVREIPGLRASVSGSTIIIDGTDESIAKAKTLAEDLDAPAFGSKDTQVYRLHNVDAASVGDLIQRSYPNIRLSVDKDLNAISVLAAAAVQQRIALATNQLDAQQGASGSPAGAPAYGGGNVEVVELQSIVPAQAGGQNDTAQNIAHGLSVGAGTPQTISAFNVGSVGAKC